MRAHVATIAGGSTLQRSRYTRRKYRRVLRRNNLTSTDNTCSLSVGREPSGNLLDKRKRCERVRTPLVDKLSTRGAATPSTSCGDMAVDHMCILQPLRSVPRGSGGASQGTFGQNKPRDVSASRGFTFPTTDRVHVWFSGIQLRFTRRLCNFECNWLSRSQKDRYGDGVAWRGTRRRGCLSVPVTEG